MSTRPGMNKAQLADVSTFVCEEYCHVLNQFFFSFSHMLTFRFTLVQCLRMIMLGNYFQLFSNSVDYYFFYENKAQWQ